MKPIERIHNLKAIEWVNDRVRLIDQTKLPGELVYLELSDYRELVSAIKEMRIRGAPVLGVAAAYAVALGAKAIENGSREGLLMEMKKVYQTIVYARPTAVNIKWAVERMRKVVEDTKDVSKIRLALVAEAKKIEAEDEEANRSLARLGAQLVQDGGTVLTHCNTGALATAGYGTALGIVRAAWESGKKLKVFATETRPFLQGARLTAWELLKEGIPVTLITDSMAGHFLSRGCINCVIVGADRIAANGDVANKIGTYTLAVLARENRVPFYVAAPTSTIDLSIPSGEGIPIEERPPEEVTHIGRVLLAPEGVEVRNPAFDITPNKYVSAIVTEKGVIRAPLGKGLSKIFKEGKGG